MKPKALFIFCSQIEFEQMKKSEGKKSREDKEKVMDMLFAAFEKHQYYNIKDLVRLTKQPVVSILWNIMINGVLYV